MSKPSKSTTMARCAASALLAAVEIYNKPTVEYREQTFALLIVNAWEVLLKARIVQECGNRLHSIYRREKNSKRYRKIQETPITITVEQALGRISVPEDVRGNIEGLILVRNEAAHMGSLSGQLQQNILQYGTATVQNFIKLARWWFNHPVHVPYLLPVGFIGAVEGTEGSLHLRQRQLLKNLSQIASKYSKVESEYAVVMKVEVQLTRKLTGGGSIGSTNDLNAPSVRVSDDEALQRYPAPYDEVVTQCARRYSDFKRNQHFYKVMKRIKEDPECAYERKLDPNNDKSAKKVFYNLENTLARLDGEYASSK